MPHNHATWRPYEEPLLTTLARTGTIALVVGAVLAQWWGGLVHWPAVALSVLWLSFGGHWLEVWFLNFLRPRLPVSPALQIGVRVALWFIGGIVLVLAMRQTALALTGIRPAHWPAWWLGGLAFISIELVAHLAMLLRGRPCFYNLRG